MRRLIGRYEYTCRGHRLVPQKYHVRRSGSSHEVAACHSAQTRGMTAYMYILPLFLLLSYSPSFPTFIDTSHSRFLCLCLLFPPLFVSLYPHFLFVPVGWLGNELRIVILELTRSYKIIK